MRGGLRLASTTFFAAGRPLPKGSGRAAMIGGRPTVVLQGAERIRAWEREIKLVASRFGAAPADCPMSLEVEFAMPRVKHPRYGLPVGRPDLDKLIRPIGDALTGVLFDDDSLIVELRALKRYARPDEPHGAIITLREYRED